ncbi:hypothetical protein FQR65_LT01369 [Abscondita terminalis]|nr:hypothetical protein FQR65_LT01369 [Abscondita terminalis]
MLAVIVFVLAFASLVYISWKPKNYPPGPKWLPFVGNYRHFKSILNKVGYHHLVWAELARIYGPVVCMKLGRILVVTVTGVDAVKEVLTRDEFDGRPDGFFFRMRTFGKRLGIVFSDGPFWQKQRKFSLQHLKNFGFGKREMELRIVEESKEFIEDLKKKSTQSIYMHNAFDVSVLNVLWTMMAGERFTLDDVRLIKLLQIIHDAFRVFDISGGLLNQMPLLRFVAPDACGYTKFMQILSEMWYFLEETIQSHRKTVCATHSRDLIDAFLQKMNVSSSEDCFTDEQLLSLCLDLFMAGSETTSNTLAFSMLYMLKYPNVQKKVQDEMDDAVGRDRCPTMQDKINLPYTEAVLMEVQRVANVPPLGIAHRATCETNLFGYRIPEGAIVLPSLYSIHMDNDFWKDPLEFRPDRFLNENGSVFSPEWYFLPFGYGKRRCLGESLARTNYFIFFTAVLHNFFLEIDSDEGELIMNGFDGPIWIPFVGSTKFLKEYSKKYGAQHVGMHELSKKWNTEILGMKLGNDYVVCVEGYENIKQILTSEDFNQRPINFFTKLRTFGTFKGITCAEGPLWVEQRSFTVRHLRNIGMGKSLMDYRIHFEIDNLIDVIDKKKEVQISKLLPFSIINILWSLIASNRIENQTFEDNQLLNIMHRRSKAFDISGGVLAQFPWIRHILPEKSGYNLIKTLNKELKEFLLETINDHHDSWSEDNNNDFIYAFISEMKKQKRNETTFTDEQLLLVCLDLFVGGFTTTSSTLDFIFLFMMLHQDVQKKVQDILDTTFSKNQSIDYQDRHKVPYVEAVIKEAQRYRFINPIIGPRRNTRKTILGGYTIPKNSTVLINLYPTFMSEEIWGDPERFRPERFLDESNGELISCPEFIPFGIGKRKCLGDTFAKGCLFLFTTEILRKFSVIPVDCNDLPSTLPLAGLTLSPRPYTARFIRR